MKQIKTKEWTKISYQELGLNQEQAKKFQRFLADKNLSHAIDFQLDGISTCAHVGIIRFADFQLNILPKIIGEEDSVCLENLMFMLRYTNELEIHPLETAKITSTRQPFLEILITHYANILLNALSRHIPHKYETFEDNLSTIKGKICFPQHFKQNAANSAKIYCQFDEFTPNNLLNQTLLFVTHALYTLTQIQGTRHKLATIKAIYEDVDLRVVSYNQTKKIILNRNQTIFKDPLALARLFLQHSSISLHNYTFSNLAILFDMNKLFEEFVATALTKVFPGQVVAQREQTIVENIGGFPNTKYTIRPDILFREDTIIDTKYKILNLPENKPSEADIYQMLAYARFYKRPNVILCYPTFRQNYPKTVILKDQAIYLNLITLNIHQKLSEQGIQNIFTIFSYPYLLS